MEEENYQSFWKEKKEYHTESSGVFFEVLKVLYSEESKFQKIEVVENEYFGRILFLDGLVQTTEKDEFYYHEMLVHPALYSHPSPKNVLIIGGGDGGTLKEVLRHPVESVHFVEIDEEVIEVCKKYFPWLKKELSDLRVNLVIEDGVKFIEKSGEFFDVVLIDSSEPIGPSTALHEKDFYRVLKTRMKPESIVVAQMGSPFFHKEELRRKFNFLKDEFQVANLYIGPVPTYPGGEWSYGFFSQKTNPLKLQREPLSCLKYYNREIHRACFSLPNVLKDLGAKLTD